MSQPGWYPSPYQQNQLQYWDGHGWSPHMKPAQIQTANPFPKKRKNSILLRIFAGVLLLIGLIPLFITAPYILHSPFDKKVEVIGEVEQLRYRTTTPNRTSNDDPSLTRQTCSPIVEYVVDGETYTARTNVFVAPCNYQKGDLVSVVHPESNPRLGVIKDQEGTTPVRSTFFALGILCFVGSCALLITSLRSKSR